MKAHLANRGQQIVSTKDFKTLEEKMPSLFAEMRQDLLVDFFTREFIAISRELTYCGQEGPYFTYYFEDHDQLPGKLKVCANYGAIQEMTFNNISRYELSEDSVEFRARTKS